ncbi:MAG: PDZ domain-containing protein [Candidatus Omnitrophica bacterium]|nr:PDZ domain-containing protein [Candidatus Omnitrophota bacterium]
MVYLRSGGSLKGLVVEEHGDRIILNTEGGEQPVFRRDIDEVFYDDPERNYLYLGSQALEAGDFAAARGFFEKALQINARFEEAEDAIHRLEDLKGKAAVKRPAAPIEVLEKGWGLRMESVSDRAVARVVREGSWAARSGIAPGDRLVSLWGWSLAYLPVEEAAGALWGPAGTSVKLTVEREAELPPATSSGRSHETGGSSGSASSGRNHWPGMTLEMERLGLTVGRVEPNGVAARAGLLPRDRIVAIGGQPTRYLPLTRAEGALYQAQGKGVHLVIHRDLMVRRE